MKQTKTWVRLVALLMCLLMVGALLVACKKKTDEPAPSDTTPPASDTSDTQEASDTISYEEELPEIKFGGKEFKMLLRNNEDMYRDMYVADSAGGDTVDKAVYLRNKTVESRFEMVLKADKSSSGNMDTDHLNAIKTGQTAYHLIANHGRGMFAYANNDTLMNWSKIPYLNYDKGYWNQGMQEDFTVNGVLYCLAGDISWHSLSAAVCMVFNKDVCTAIGEEYPYAAVQNDEWTFEKFKTMALKAGAGASLKLDPINNASDKTATLGYMTTQFRGPLTVLYAGGGSVVSLNEDKTALELTLNTERNNTIFAEYFALNNNNNIQMYKTGNGNEHFKAFATGNILFFDTRIGDVGVIKNFGMETDKFGIIPWPKYDDAVDGYYAWSDAIGNTFGVPKGWADTEYEFVGVVMEALCAEGYRVVTPKYYSNILQSQYSDAASVEMINIIRDGRRYDIASYMMSGSDYGEIGNAGTKLLLNGQTLAAWWPTVETQAVAGLQEINDTFELLGQLDSVS
ncbi:MAG: hypothetical protein IJW44_04000 [Clostridia bacterium]|nr:hypothetical protein [Clostridia bacterium]